MKVYKVPGTNNAANYFDISDWETGSGGSWENWYIQNGNFQTTTSENPECSSLSIDDYNDFSIEVFPNPFLNKIQFSKDISDVKMQMYNAFGKELFLKFDSENSIDTSNLSSGIYLLRFLSGDTQHNLKLLKK